MATRTYYEVHSLLEPYDRCNDLVEAKQSAQHILDTDMTVDCLYIYEITEENPDGLAWRMVNDSCIDCLQR